MYYEYRRIMGVLILLFLLDVWWFCNGLVVNPSSLSFSGDPAPGRSPGPPDLDQDNPTIVINSDLTNTLCTLHGKIIPAESNPFNITISHKLFKTDVLAPGVKYQVLVRRLKTGPPLDLTILSSVGAAELGIFEGAPDDFNCQPNTLRSQLHTQLTFNWTFEGDAIGNATFDLRYQVEGDVNVYQATHQVATRPDCQLSFGLDEGTVTFKDLPHLSDCQVWFPRHETGHGVVIELNRLNVPCSRGFLHFSGLNTSSTPANSHLQHLRSHKQTHLCGKLEELPEADRHIYFPSSHTQPYMHVHGTPVFSLYYHLVDYCYNVTFVTRNGSFELKPSGDLQCTFKIYLPYGNRVALNLHIGDSTSTGTPETGLTFQDVKNGETVCEGLLTELYDGSNTWSHCTKTGDAERQIEIVSRENKVVLKVYVRGGKGALGLRLSYRAEPVEDVVGLCGFGWVAVRQFCVTAVEAARLPWAQAEMECGRRGGHLASIRNEQDQTIIDNLLFNSPGYRDHNAYWIGASDKTHEGDFRWSDGLPFAYTNWFPGWAQHGHYNKQPNDDGLSKQDCVEARRIYSLPTSSASLAATFMWNDRDCSTPNYFLCERLQNDEPLEDSWPPDCNRTVILSRQQPRAAVSSPGFPRQYPDNAACVTDITAPSGYRLVLEFEELVLEDEPSCSYDYLEILEAAGTSSNGSQFAPTTNGSQENSRRLCGDWSSKLKLLRYVSNGSKLKLRFVSDYSHHFGGFKARISMENVVQCADDRLHMFNSSCYLIVNYPEVTWLTAQQICRGMRASLASVLSPEEERFITSNIRKTTEYRTSAFYWLGANAAQPSEDFQWIDGNPMNFLGWLPGQKPAKSEFKCRGIQWSTSPTPMLASGLYWKAQRCNKVGGYVCKRRHLLTGSEMNLNQTINGTGGNLTSPNHPGNYYNNLDVSIRIVGPDRTRIVVKFQKLDIESQLDCLYDYVALKTSHVRAEDSVKWCGSHETAMQRFDFVSSDNEVLLTFHSDHSISGLGFSLTWEAVDVSACPEHTLTAKEGVIISPNYPHSLLPHLDCTITILAPSGKRVWLDFVTPMKFQDDETIFEVTLGKESSGFRPFQLENLLTEGTFISTEERLKIRLVTGDRPLGIGFKAIYKTLSNFQGERIVRLSNVTSGQLLNLNYPDNPPSNINYLQHFVAPLGHVIILELHHVRIITESLLYECQGLIEVYDNYSDMNGTIWKLCYEDTFIPLTPPIAITSYLNTLHIRQKSGFMGTPLNGSLRVHPDNAYKTKLLSFKEERIESCLPNPCQQGGKCVDKHSHPFCKCTGHFTGMFCALTHCELEPCIFGTCELTNTSFKCHCKQGYLGSTCDQKRKPCDGNPCESRGSCIERGDSFQCRCHAWWEGSRCEKRMMHIPYKPLSERMLHEPFWLGLMTVFVVMAVIGLVWCAKRHFPEKIEKLLAEESERNRSTMSSLRSASVREQLAAASSAVAAVAPSPGPGPPRSLFGRLGIRKPSILSLTSPHASGYAPATARTFSLDDLLKPPPRRSPSPKKKRNNSTPTKKNVAEKKQILQQLISPGSKQHTRKVSLGELIQMSERKFDGNEGVKAELTVKETKFSDLDPVQSALNDPKLEKKVTFARLLNKVSAEMSSGSDMEMGIMQTNRLGCMFARPSSTPPSPGIDARSPNSTSSNQGSDSFTASSDLAIPSAFSSSISDLLGSSCKRKMPNGRPKPASADSILAMFRNFSSSSAGANLPSSLRVSPSTTPTASSPQDDIVGDDESSTTSSVYTPVLSESPVFHQRNAQSTIEVPVLDPLSAHKSSSSNFLHPPTILLEIPSTINKCLSPIREMPTPLPSPALTPIMRRSNASSSLEDAELSDDHISIELPNISISSDAEEEIRCQDIAIDPQAEDGLIFEEAASMHQAAFKTKNRPPPLGQLAEPIITIQPPSPLLIPTFTIQTPSPTHTKTPSLLFPAGSPPPHRSQTENESCFQFPPPPKQSNSRKHFKDFDKPTSLDLPCAPPMITITCNLSEAESDVESISPAVKSSAHHLGGSSSGMTYLSPFSMAAARGDHTASESNLSSSGYSSMASPGPSRCGSSNPLCPSEMEDQGGPGSGHSQRRQSITPVLKTTSNSSECSGSINNKNEEQRRGRSDSETLSDDPQLESNDEGIGTDHIDEKIDDGELKSAKDLELFMVISDTKTIIDLPVVPGSLTRTTSKSLSLEDTIDRLLPPSSSKKSLQLPSIIIQCDTIGSCEKHLSPMSSRSESPLSDRTTGFGRFSPQFYGRNKDLLPFTDSDGLYDFPSSDKVNVTSNVQHKKVGRRREKKLTRNCKTPSPTKSLQPALPCNHLDVPSNKDGFYRVPPPRKLSPKRRVTRSQVVSSSSSSDSINSTREIKLSSSSPSPDTIRWSSPVSWINEKCPKTVEVASQETFDDAATKPEQPLVKHQKISRLRAISHQIRFLRRLELSLKRRERTISPSDSLESGEEESSPKATSPLLLPKGPKLEIRKSSSIGKLQSSSTPCKNRRGKFKRGELLLPQDEMAWKKVVITGSGHSD